MNKLKNIIKDVLIITPFVVGMASCKKLDQPVLPSDYPQDNAVTPTTSLRFYLPFDSTKVEAKQLNIRFADSISTYPSFFPDGSTTAVAGVRGTAYQGSSKTYLHYYSANDFASSKSFTVSYWSKITVAQKDHVNANGILALTSTTNFWANMTVFAEHEVSTSDSMPLKFHFANGTGDNWDFQYADAKRLPQMYDGNWHHIAFVYDASASTGTLYKDGVQFDKKSGETIAFDKNASQFIVGGFSQMAGISGKASDNTWQSGFPGALDQIRLYNTALSAADVAALYANKQ